jgi:hypothetical protein
LFGDSTMTSAVKRTPRVHGRQMTVDRAIP